MPKYLVSFTIPATKSAGDIVVETDAPFALEHVELTRGMILANLSPRNSLLRTRDVALGAVNLLMKYGGDKPTVTLVEY